MKKLLVFLVMFFIAATYLPEITVWFSWEGYNQFKSIVSNFEKEAGIKVNVVYVRKMDEKLAATMKAGYKYLPDVALVMNDKIYKYKNIFEDLSNIDMNGFLKKSVNAFKVDGKILAMPFYFDIGGVIFYNKDLVKDPGKVSLEKILEIGKTLDLHYPVVLPIYGTYYFQVFQRTFGKKNVVSEPLTFQDPYTKKALEFITKISREINVPKDRRGLVVLFMRGDAAFFMFGSFMIPSFMSKKINFGIVDVPYVEAAENMLSANLDYKGFVVIKGRMNDEVKEFLEYMKKTEVQLRFCKALYKIPTILEAKEKLESQDEIFMKLAGYEKYGSPTPTSELSSIYYEAVGSMIRAMMKGETDLDKLIEIAEKVVQEWK